MLSGTPPAEAPRDSRRHRNHYVRGRLRRQLGTNTPGPSRFFGPTWTERPGGLVTSWPKGRDSCRVPRSSAVLPLDRLPTPSG